jgi:hypothetical protein
MSTTTAGAPPTAISMGETVSPTSVVVRGSTVFWLDGLVIRKSVAGVISVVTTSASPIHGITASDDGASIFFSTGTKVQKVSAAGGTPVDVAIEEKLGVPGALAVQGSLLVFPTNFNGDIDIATLGATPALCATSPGESDPWFPNFMCQRVARSQGSLNQSIILSTGPSVLWIDGPEVKLNELSATAAASNVTVAQTDAPVRSMALGAGKVFYVAFDDADPAAGTVAKAALIEGGASVPLARAIKGPGSVAVDGKKVFWSTADCEIQTTATGE